MVWWAESGFGGVFRLCGSAAIVLRVPFWGCVLVVLWWFRWRRFSVVFLWCEKLLWPGGFAVSCCCICGGVSKRSAGEEWCREVLGKSVVEMRGGQNVGAKKCCRTYWKGVGKSGVEKCWGGGVRRSVGKERGKDVGSAV